MKRIVLQDLIRTSCFSFSMSLSTRCEPMKPAPPVTRILRFACTHTQTPTNNQTRSSDRATYTARSSDRIPAKSPGRTWRTGAARASAAGGWCAPRCCCHWPPSAPSRRAPGTHKNATDPPSPTLRSSQSPKKKKTNTTQTTKSKPPSTPHTRSRSTTTEMDQKKKHGSGGMLTLPLGREGLGGRGEQAWKRRVWIGLDRRRTRKKASQIWAVFIAAPLLSPPRTTMQAEAARTRTNTHRLLPTGPRSRCPWSIYPTPQLIPPTPKAKRDLQKERKKTIWWRLIKNDNPCNAVWQVTTASAGWRFQRKQRLAGAGGTPGRWRQLSEPEIWTPDPSTAPNEG